MYSEKVMDHFYHPRNVGEIEDADGEGVAGNPVCGDVMKITIKVDRERETIKDIKLNGKDLTLEEAMKITNKTVAEALDGLPPIKMHCSNLAADALHAAIEDYLKKKANQETLK